VCMSTRRTPQSILGIAPGASADEIRAARSRLSRQHHPDRFAGAPAGARAANREMALINASAQALLDEVWAVEAPPAPTPPVRGGHRPERPVTARVNVAESLRANARTSAPTKILWRPAAAARPRDAATGPLPGSPAGPVERRIDASVAPRRRPSLDLARAYVLPFGRYAGGTIAQVARRDPGYLAWCVDNVRRDAELVAAANVMLEELERSGAFRRPPRGSLFRPSPSAFGGASDGVDA